MSKYKVTGVVYIEVEELIDKIAEAEDEEVAMEVAVGNILSNVIDYDLEVKKIREGETNDS